MFFREADRFKGAAEIFPRFVETSESGAYGYILAQRDFLKRFAFEKTAHKDVFSEGGRAPSAVFTVSLRMSSRSLRRFISSISFTSVCVGMPFFRCTLIKLLCRRDLNAKS